MCTDIQTDRDTKHRATAGVIIYIMIYSAIMCPHSQGMAHASLCIPAPKKKNRQTGIHIHSRNRGQRQASSRRRRATLSILRSAIHTKFDIRTNTRTNTHTIILVLIQCMLCTTGGNGSIILVLLLVLMHCMLCTTGGNGRHHRADGVLSSRYYSSPYAAQGQKLQVCVVKCAVCV